MFCWVVWGLLFENGSLQMGGFFSFGQESFEELFWALPWVL
jgi:hypothetical protein